MKSKHNLSFNPLLSKDNNFKPSFIMDPILYLIYTFIFALKMLLPLDFVNNIFNFKSNKFQIN